MLVVEKCGGQAIDGLGGAVERQGYPRWVHWEIGWCSWRRLGDMDDGLRCGIAAVASVNLPASKRE